MCAVRKKPIVYLTTFIIPTPDSILFLFLLDLGRNPLLNTVQLLHPLVQSRRKPANLLPRKHARLHPRYIRLFVNLVQRTSNKLQAVHEGESFSTRHHGLVFDVTNLSAFITRCSTSSTGSRVSSATVWKVIVRSLTGLLNTLSISAIRHIFCRKNA